MKITKIKGLDRDADPSVAALAIRVRGPYFALRKFSEAYSIEPYRRMYEELGTDFAREKYEEALEIDKLISEYKEKFEEVILDIANAVLQISDKDRKLCSNNKSDYAAARPMSPLEDELVGVKQNLFNFLSSTDSKDSKTRLERIKEPLEENLAALGKIKEKAEKSKGLGGSPLDEIPTKSAAILFATSLSNIGASKFLPEAMQKGLGSQALRYMNYAFLAASSAVLLAKGGSALKKKLQDKKSNGKEKQDPPALQ